MPDDEYADIRERKKRVAKVKKDLRTYAEGILQKTSWLEGDEIQYYFKIVECEQQFWDKKWDFEKIIALPEAERRIREVVRPTLTAALEMKTENGVWVHALWFMNPESITPIHEYVKKWFGEQTEEEALRADCLYRLYQMCEYQEPGAFALEGLHSFKLACFPVYLAVADAHKNPETHLERVLKAMWYLQDAGEKFVNLLTPETDKVKDDLWALFELLPRTGSKEWRFDAEVELRDWKSNGFLDLLMSCVRMFFHFDGKQWEPTLLISKYDALTVLRLIDDPSRGMRRYLKKIQDGNLTSEVSDDIRTKYETWSAYVLSWLDDNRAYLTRLHTEQEVIREKERQSWSNRNDAHLLQLLDELKAHV
jgi:hypothetical protein